MSFDAYGTGQSAGGNGGSNVDFDAMNKYVVETCELQQPETLPGYVSAIVDLGTQEQPNSEFLFEEKYGTEQEQIDKAKAEGKECWFETKDYYDKGNKIPNSRVKVMPQQPLQAVAIAVDFPDIMVDKGQFFGTSNPQPLRLWMGGQFWMQSVGKQVVGRPTYMKVTGKDRPIVNGKPDWSFPPLHVFYKMAVAAKLINKGDAFLPNQIDSLLGKVFQFEAQVWMKPNKNDPSKQYYTENVKFAAAMGRGMAMPELKTEPFLVQMKKENDPEKLKEVRAHVKNTMMLSPDFAGSVVEKQFEEIAGGKTQNNGTAGDYEPPKSTPQEPEHMKEYVPDNATSAGAGWDDEDNIPF